MRTIGRRFVAIGFALALVAGGAVPAMAAEPDPVLLVHGYRGSPSTWADMIARFAAAGRTAVAIDLASEDNIVNAKAIAAFITAKGWKRVDIVGQSMGGLSARHYNSGDDTPAGVYWTTIYSRTDGIVSNSSSRLDGGACHVFEDPGVGHNSMDNDPTIFQHVLAATNASCAGTFR
jgi:triacylglycerol esterase/lipase EstA (alpha/beta hydrolase family)